MRTFWRWFGALWCRLFPLHLQALAELDPNAITPKAVARAMGVTVWMAKSLLRTGERRGSFERVADDVWRLVSVAESNEQV